MQRERESGLSIYYFSMVRVWIKIFKHVPLLLWFWSDQIEFGSSDFYHVLQDYRLGLFVDISMRGIHQKKKKKPKTKQKTGPEQLVPLEMYVDLKLKGIIALQEHVLSFASPRTFEKQNIMCSQTSNTPGFAHL